MTCVNLLKLITDTIAPVPGHLAPKPQIPCKKPQEFILVDFNYVPQGPEH